MSRQKRMAVYKKKLGVIPIMKYGCINGKAVRLKSPKKLDSMKVNFKQLVKENFVQLSQDEFNNNGTLIWPKIKTGINAYNEFKKFSETVFGSGIIALILKDNVSRKKRKKEVFRILYNKNETGQQAHGNRNFIIFGPNFPKSTPFKGGEKKRAVTIIAHELGHTRLFYLKKNGKLNCQNSETQLDNITIIMEREAVRYIENPFLMKLGYEPRYTYHKSGEIINIIIGIKSKTHHTILIDDPSVLAVIGSKGARR